MAAFVEKRRPLDRPLMPEGAASLRYEVEDAVATLTLDRPEARNALDATLKRELLAAITAAGADPAVRVVVLTGAGAAFCAGQDLRETTRPDAPSLSTILRETYNPLILAMRRLEKPILGSINGVAAGAGMALALACDLRIAADTATFVLAFGRVGLVPDSGTTWFLPRLVGPAVAADLALLGDPLPAVEAERRGLVSRVVPAADLARETPDPRHPPRRRRAPGRRADEGRPQPVVRGEPRGAARARVRAPGHRGAHRRPSRGRRGVPGETAAPVHRGVARSGAGPRRRLDPPRRGRVRFGA